MRVALRGVFRYSVVLCSIALAACGGGGGGDSGRPQARTVTVAWDANRETGVNSAGGGYEVSITGLAPIDIPYAPGAPTSITKVLQPGTYLVTVRAYAALDPLGGNTKTFSALSQIVVTVQ